MRHDFFSISSRAYQGFRPRRLPRGFYEPFYPLTTLVLVLVFAIRRQYNAVPVSGKHTNVQVPRYYGYD
jgi:hypothetical protein